MSDLLLALLVLRNKLKNLLLFCTSGSALLNYYPAFAFYSQIPMIVISADRPQSKIDIGDGQILKQQGCLKIRQVTSIPLKILKI
jgi:2-succinyl-5-enolpyruvyl-6-hydroxy-3-cyclohexene-1-carboxylate synthase